jgi:hypothetical protein
VIGSERTALINVTVTASSSGGGGGGGEPVSTTYDVLLEIRDLDLSTYTPRVEGLGMVMYKYGECPRGNTTGRIYQTWDTYPELTGRTKLEAVYAAKMPYDVGVRLLTNMYGSTTAHPVNGSYNFVWNGVQDHTPHVHHECADVFIIDDSNKVYGFLYPKGIYDNPLGNNALWANNNKLIHVHFRELKEAGMSGTHKYVLKVNAKYDNKLGDVDVTIEPK